MKQIALTLLILCGLCALASAGPEAISSKEMKETVQPIVPTQWYADREWNIGIWGTYVFTANGEEMAENQPAPVPCWESDRYLGTDEAWGGGIDLRYFFHRYFGVGIEGYALAVHRDAPETGNLDVGRLKTPATPKDEDRTVGSVLGTLTLRFPFGRFAPYAFAGGGVTFGGGDVQTIEITSNRGNGHDYAELYRGGDTSAAIGQFGGGLEMRVTPHIGLMSDFSWNVVDGPNNNFGMVRSGLNFAF
jgi:hypothetical protein